MNPDAKGPAPPPEVGGGAFFMKVNPECGGDVVAMLNIATTPVGQVRGKSAAPTLVKP